MTSDEKNLRGVLHRAHKWVAAPPNRTRVDGGRSAAGTTTSFRNAVPTSSCYHFHVLVREYGKPCSCPAGTHLMIVHHLDALRLCVAGAAVVNVHTAIRLGVPAPRAGQIYVLIVIGADANFARRLFFCDCPACASRQPAGCDGGNNARARPTSLRPARRRRGTRGVAIVGQNGMVPRGTGYFGVLGHFWDYTSLTQLTVNSQTFQLRPVLK